MRRPSSSRLPTLSNIVCTLWFWILWHLSSPISSLPLSVLLHLLVGADCYLSLILTAFRIYGSRWAYAVTYLLKKGLALVSLGTSTQALSRKTRLSFSMTSLFCSSRTMARMRS